MKGQDIVEGIMAVMLIIVVVFAIGVLMGWWSPAV